MTGFYDRARSRKTYSFFATKPTIKFSGSDTYISGGFGTDVFSDEPNRVELSINDQLFSGVFGNRVLTGSNQIVFSGTVTSQQVQLQNVFVTKVTTDISATNAGVWGVMNGLTSSITVSSGSSIMFKLSMGATTNNQGYAGALRIVLNNVEVTGSSKISSFWNNLAAERDPHTANVYCVTPPLTASTYQVRAEWTTGVFGYTATALFCYASSSSEKYSAWFMGQEVRRV